jgi:hypothetical protein
MPAHQIVVIAACLAGALVVTLVLAAFLTPRSWWRRANARALAVLAGGTALFGCLFVLAAGAWPHRPPADPVALAMPLPLPLAVQVPAPAARLPVHDYRVFDDLNLRAASGTGAPRIAVVPDGATVTTTGRVDGDWWEVTARVNGRLVTGWASSLWLRRGDERS